PVSHGGRVSYRVDNMVDDPVTGNHTAANMTAMINNISASTWTPLSETMWEAYRYLGGLSVDYGDNDSSAIPARDLSAQNGSNYITPFEFSCQQAYIIYVTDGDPTYDGNAVSKISGL